MIGTHDKPNTAQLPRATPLASKIFNLYNRRYLRRSFHSVRILQSGKPEIPSRPVVLYLNHSSWWDPLVCLFLSQYFFPDRISFGPIDAAMLERYRFFRHLGFFGIKRDDARRGATFLGTARALLASSRNIIWLTPQGKFADSRVRPLEFQAGLGALAARTRGVAFMSLAVEYTFWTESRPEILLSFGEPLVPSEHSPLSPNEWSRIFRDALATAQDDLASRSSHRRPEDWDILQTGRVGVNRPYDAWRWLRATMGGRPFRPEHQPGFNA